jgi:hypothetical protein
MKLTIASLIIAIAAVVALGQGPTLQIVTADPNLPSELFYGSVKVKPLRVRPGTNPPQFITIDDQDFFTQEQYIDFLNRMPDQSGFQFWLNQITNCGSNNPGCTEVMRINVSASFFLSIEFKETGYLAERTYKSAFGDAQNAVSTFNGNHNIVAPVIRFSEFLNDIKQIGNGVVVLQPGWEAALEANKVAYFNSFVQRSSFTNIFSSKTNDQFVDLLNSNAGNPLSQTERNQLVSDLTGGNKTRAQVLRAVAEDQDLVNAEFNRAFVLMQYYGYLRRDPNGGQDTDYTGYDFWLQKLNQFNGNYINAEMVKAFISSIEYRNRF